MLTQVGFNDLKQIGGEQLAYAVIKIRTGPAEVNAGFNGQYGTVRPII